MMKEGGNVERNKTGRRKIAANTWVDRNFYTAFA
jgi:hypothetical protein